MNKNCKLKTKKSRLKIPTFKKYLDEVTRNYVTSQDVNPSDPEDLQILKDQYREIVGDIKEFEKRPHIFRLMNVRDEKKFVRDVKTGKETKLGDYWSMSFPRPDAGQLPHTYNVEIEAKINPRDLDVTETMIQNAAFSYEGEAVLKPGSRGKLLRVNKRRINKNIEFG